MKMVLRDARKKLHSPQDICAPLHSRPPLRSTQKCIGKRSLQHKKSLLLASAWQGQRSVKIALAPEKDKMKKETKNVTRENTPAGHSKGCRELPPTQSHEQMVGSQCFEFQSSRLPNPSPQSFL